MDVIRLLGTTWSSLGAVLVATVATFAWVILLTRATGPRSLATFSSFDFAATVAVGSTLSSTALGSAPLVAGVVVLFLVYGLQYAIARLRRRRALAGAVDNRPLLLMAGGRILEDAMAEARLSRSELMAQLRLAGVRHLADVHAVVLETSGALSVATGDRQFDVALLAEVRGAEALR